MKDRLYYNELFELYKSLLTTKEQTTFADYYGEDLSLKEIAENTSVTRSAVQKTIKNVIVKLDDYEEKLKLNQKNRILKEVLDMDNIAQIKRKLAELA